MKEQVKKMGTQGSAIYGMAVLGALVYFIQHAHTFWNGAVGIIKAIFWPAMVIYKVLELLKL
ncbi:hypothetical protein DYU05_10860 [Mucilaginibacter terrenus]|uniref:Uncharacterized protein n=1 Tax=Mucilaginibacter terrenus TaxID=2482727 RepID=A0A3E2NNT9_9SPHI|nr:hypothetical protein [Mucilaginibacter terrenus]RFZ82675.1 hypothetical protein DYU05_10860 [Mucilaginibacter terrenus]